jgi:hypothetical protein
MTWGEVFMLQEYWKEHPPVHLLVAAYLGIKPKHKGKSKADQPSLRALAGMFGGVK